jgi:hypothetical protein
MSPQIFSQEDQKDRRDFWSPSLNDVRVATLEHVSELGTATRTRFDLAPLLDLLTF